MKDMFDTKMSGNPRRGSIAFGDSVNKQNRTTLIKLSSKFTFDFLQIPFAGKDTPFYVVGSATADSVGGEKAKNAPCRICMLHTN
jgi:hypothetical protein